MSDRTPQLDAPLPEVMTITLRHTGPVELAALSESLHALANQHTRFAERSGATIGGDKVKLFVRDIRSGSIIVELVAMAQTAGVLAGSVNTVVSFAKNLRSMLDYGTGAAAKPPSDTTARDARDLSAFLQPVASDVNGSVVVTVTNSSNVTVNNINIDSNTANAVQNRLTNWAAVQVEPVNGPHAQQLFYFAQATGDPTKPTGDRGIIERFGRRAVKTVFANQESKAAMLSEALFTKLYIVDVDVQTVGGEPRLYRITRVHETMDRDD